jgi:hypothetical protein
LLRSSLHWARKCRGSTTSVSVHALLLLAQNRGNHPDHVQVDMVISELASEMQTRISGIQDRFKEFPYPFPHPRGQLTVAEYVRSEKPTENEGKRAYLEGDAHVERLFTLHFRLLGKLLAHADIAEKTLET